jgi:hypothetical protein
MKPSVSVCMKPMYRDIGHAISAGENELIAAWFNQQRAILLAIQRQPAGLWNLDLKHASDRPTAPNGVEPCLFELPPPLSSLPTTSAYAGCLNAVT